MIQVLVGRESSTNKLKLSIGEKTKVFGCVNSVPQSVSRQHCLITINQQNNSMSINNMKITNATFVNGLQIESCKVTTQDIIELGFEHYQLSWDTVMGFVKSQQGSAPKEVDIRGHERIWIEYKRELDKLQKTQTMTNVLRGGLPILTIGGVALGLFINRNGKGTSSYMVVVYAVALVLMVILFLKSWIEAQRIPKRREELNRKLVHHYSCPNCGYFFGYQPYDVIKTNLDTCPKCKSNLKK